MTTSELVGLKNGEEEGKGTDILNAGASFPMSDALSVPPSTNDLTILVRLNLPRVSFKFVDVGVMVSQDSSANGTEDKVSRLKASEVGSSIVISRHRMLLVSIWTKYDGKLFRRPTFDTM
ncbi:hypothetical protein HAX54_029086 [Datura stramonium]|uniref:Uncharacterized protein n=1 Tax=Datura stramonium TaxID=4076 RepID=A0ABS8RLB0_DATST|nr:hypothetical protein [Datura stramonium]